MTGGRILVGATAIVLAVLAWSPVSFAQEAVLFEEASSGILELSGHSRLDIEGFAGTVFVRAGKRGELRYSAATRTARREPHPVALWLRGGKIIFRPVAGLEAATRWIAKVRASDPEEIGAASYDYLKLMALVSLGYMWARAAAVANLKVAGDNSGFYQAKLTTARFYMKRLLPQAEALGKTLQAGSGTLMDLPAESF